MVKGIITLRNAASDLDVFLEIFCQVAETVGTHFFGLEALVNIAVEKGLMSSKGRKGEEARARSYNKNMSLDSMLMQFKAYAEMYRLLGWIRSVSNECRTKYKITFLGYLLCTIPATSRRNLMEQCFLGITLPNGVVDRECQNRTQLLWCYLNALYDSPTPLSRDQFLYVCHAIADDADTNNFSRRLEEITSVTKTEVKEILESLAKDESIQKNTLSNSTRFTIAALKNFGWTSESKYRYCLTDYGREIVERYRGGIHFTYADALNLDVDTLKAISVVGLVQMLDRSKIDTLEIRSLLGYGIALDNLVGFIPTEKELYFSPYQVLDPDRLKAIFGRSIENIEETEFQIADSTLTETECEILRSVLPLSSHKLSADSVGSLGLLSETIDGLRDKNSEEIADLICNKFANAKQDVFYDLVSEAFRIMHFDCRTGRQGQNSFRCDAIIEAGEKSIPIEIKSPTEEMAVSVKAIRQALENRVILAARPPYNTPKEISSLVVGYEYPAARSEVHELISAIYSLYGIKIAIISFRELVKVAADSLQGKYSPSLADLTGLIGEVRVGDMPCK